MHEEILDKMQKLLKDEIENFAGDFGGAEKEWDELWSKKPLAARKIYLQS